jgi:hypothetical protein
MSEWKYTSLKGGKREKVPYEECPNCGNYKYREIEITKSPIFGDTELVNYKKCKFCKYEEDME